MNPLLHLEKKFQDYLLQANQSIFEDIISTDKIPADIRLSIYGNGYRSRLYEALTVSYPVLKRYLGDASFEKLAYLYIDSHPSPFRSIRWFGDHLAVFLNRHVLYQEQPYLSELAQLEWVMASVFDAADSLVVELEKMATIPPEAWITMRLQLHPSVQCLTFSWNVVAIWQALTDEKIPPGPQRNESTMHWILWRKELKSQFAAVPEDEAWALEAVIKQFTFGELCAGLCQWVDEQQVGLRAASLLKSWITAGLIAEIAVFARSEATKQSSALKQRC